MASNAQAISNEEQKEEPASPNLQEQYQKRPLPEPGSITVTEKDSSPQADK